MHSLISHFDYHSIYQAPAYPSILYILLTLWDWTILEINKLSVLTLSIFDVFK